MKYWRLRVEVAEALAEVAAATLGAVTGGVAVERPFEATGHDGEWRYAPEDGAVSVTGYLPMDGREAARLDDARGALAAAGLPAPALSPVDEVDWAEAWKRFFRVQRVGRVVIRPSWRRYTPRPGETVVDLDPGMAFGTGQHPTTRMCLRELQDLLAPADRVLDAGCGSGILTVAAARLGAGHVVAVDTEPLAVEATRRNAAANAVEACVEVSAGTLTPALADAGYDLVVANINAATLLALAPLLAAATRPGGHLVVSGLLEAGAAAVERALTGAGMRVRRRRRGGDWRALTLRRPVANETRPAADGP